MKLLRREYRHTHKNMNRKGQSILEYGIIIAVVGAAFMSMFQYVYRAMNARFKQVQDEVYQSPSPGNSAVGTPVASSSK